MTDEGQRQLKVLDFSVEWYNLEHIPLIELHFLTNRSPPLISQPVPKCRLTASPRGKPRGANFCVYALVGVDEQSTRHTSTPKGRFVLRADSIRPYNPCGKLAPFNQRLNRRELAGC